MLKTMVANGNQSFHPLQLYNTVDAGEVLSVEKIAKYMKKKFPKANAKRILGVESEYDDQRQVNSVYSRYNY